MSRLVPLRLAHLTRVTSWRSVAFAIVALLAWLSAPTSSRAQTPAPAPAAGDTGLDVVMLVDVSGSMWLKKGWQRDGRNDGPIGNDPDRLRWDAVMLVLDMLVDEDRLLVLPFNEHCPATLSKTSQRFAGEQRVPGDLEESLTLMAESPAKKKLRNKIESFIHIDQPYAESKLEFNGDEGGTHLLEALRKATKAIEETLASRAAGRKSVVILLTDGEEQPGDDRDLIDHDLLRDTQDETQIPVLRSLRDRAIPVYTLALGDDIKSSGHSFLEKLSNFTNGHAYKVKTNDQIVHPLRQLIWSLRTCFVSESPFTFKDRTTESSGDLAGAIDLAAIVSDRPVSGDVTLAPKSLSYRRTALAPKPELVRRWNPDWKGSPSLQLPPTTGKMLSGGRASGYAFHYWDFRVRGAMPPEQAELLANREMQLEYREALPVDRSLEGYFVKRMAVSFDLEIEKPLFYRNEPIQVRVRPRLPFGNVVDLSSFSMEARLHQSYSKAPSQGATATLTLQDGVFVVKEGIALTAESLPFGSGEVEQFSLEVTVRQASKTAAGETRVFQHRLPPRLVRVLNAVPLRAPANDLTLEEDSRLLSIPVETQYPLARDLRVKVELSMPPRFEKSENPVAREHFLWDSTLTLKNGEGKIVVRVKPIDGRYPTDIGVYKRGSLRVVADDKDFPVRVTTWENNLRLEDWRPHHDIPFGMRVGKVGLKFDPTEVVELRVGPTSGGTFEAIKVTAESNRKIRLHPAKKEEGVKVASYPSVRIVPEVEEGRSPPVSYAPEELWIQPEGTGPQQTKDRRQEVALQEFGESLVVYFQPRPVLHGSDQAKLVGVHRFRLEAYGDRFDPLELPLRLVVTPPRVEVSWKKLPPEGPVLAPGANWPAILQSRMKWLSDAELSFRLSPSDAIDCIPALMVPFTGGAEPIVLKSSGDAATLPTETSVQFEIPMTAPFRRYTGEIKLLLADREYGTAPVVFRLNALQVSGTLISKQKRAAFAEFPERINDHLPDSTNPVVPLVVDSTVRFRQWFDAGATYSMVVRPQQQQSLQSQFARLEFETAGVPKGKGPFLASDSNDASNGGRFPVDHVPAPTWKFRAGSDAGLGPHELILDLAFPSVVNAHPDVPYKITGRIVYDDPASGVKPRAAEFTLEVRYFEAKRALRGAARDGVGP